VPTSERRRPAPDGQEVEWLTPAPDGAPVVLRWPDENGPLLLTCHLARVDGRTMLVGLDVRTFTTDGATPGDTAPAGSLGATPGPKGLTELNHIALRSLRAGEIAEAARATLVAMVAATAGSSSWDESVRAAAARRVEVLTSPNKSRDAGVRPVSDQLQRVAELYLRAVAAGGDTARRPSVHVYRALIKDGTDVSLNTVRGRIHRARVKGLIPPAKG
jgi:hypothetical protein